MIKPTNFPHNISKLDFVDESHKSNGSIIKINTTSIKTPYFGNKEKKLGDLLCPYDSSQNLHQWFYTL